MTTKESIKGSAREIRTLPKRRRIRHILSQLTHGYDSPRRLSIAIGVGVFIGTLPFFGFHIGIALLVALIARLNKLAVLFGTQVSLPWIAPFLIFASVQIGELLLYGQFLKINIPSFHSEDFIPFIFPLLYSWLIGSLILGALLGLLSFGLSLYLIPKWKRRRGKIMNSQTDSKGAVTK